MYSYAQENSTLSSSSNPHCYYSDHRKENTVGFKLMEISVAVLGLTGIMTENKARKQSKKKAKEKRGNNDKISTASSCSSSYSMEGDDGVPVKAVVSFFKYVNNSKTAIASHLPSLSVQHVDTTSNGLCQLSAFWPNDFDPLGNELSTFKFTRMMQIENEGHRTNKYRSVDTPMLIPERVQLKVSLTRGSEMVTVGYATLVVSGDETQDMQMNLPISLERVEENDKATWKNRKTIKPTAFSKDPFKRHYFLNGHSRLKVLLHVSPVEKSKDRALHSSQDVPEAVSISSASGSQSYDHRDLPVPHLPIDGTMQNNRDCDNMTIHEYPYYYYYETPTSDHVVEEDYNHDDSTFGEYSIEDTTDGTVATNTSKLSIFTKIMNLLSCEGNSCVATPRVVMSRKYRNNSNTNPNVLSTKNSSQHVHKLRGRRAQPRGSKSSYIDRHDEFSVATEKVQNLRYPNNTRSYDESSQDILEAKHEVDKFAARIGIDPTKII